jgi:DNA-binding response OmpR family regulator
LKRILLVEDDPDGRRLLSQLLQRAEMIIEAVPTAEDAVWLLDRYRYDVVIIDLTLPGMGGLDLLTNIRRNAYTARLCCVAVTAFDSPNIKKRALELGFNAYFAKPLDVDTFVSELLSVVDENGA